ncbi:MAG: hypothetical protein LBU03_06305 [Tannerellaceae bacterium]|jgi:hypothetical protein|nr:hypothetical protein [Tannerellaceae bacterium]
MKIVELIERIRYYGRRNKFKSYIKETGFYKKHCKSSVKHIRNFLWKYYYIKYDFLWVYKYYIKYYSFRKDKEVSGNTVYLIIDPSLKYGGLVDRLNVMVGCYYIAKVNGFEFKIISDPPFRIDDYVEVNGYNWLSEKAALSYNLRNVRVIPYIVRGRGIPRLNKGIKQYHVSFVMGHDILQDNNIPDHGILWGQLYNTLFKPREYILRRMKDTGLQENEYIAVHLRFMNALEHVEDRQFNSLPSEKQEKLIARCFGGISKILAENNTHPVVIFSDSNVFLKLVKVLPVYVLEGKVGHISYNKETEFCAKAFFDFYMISKARKIYAIRAPEMYTGGYSSHAAMVGYKEVIIVKV